MIEWRKTLFCLMVIIVAYPVRGQIQTYITIDGRVIDAEDKKPVSNVLVKIINPHSPDRKIITYTESDKNGEFRLRVEPGFTEIDMEFSLIGFRKESVRLKAQTQTVNQELQVTEFALKEFVVKAPPVSARGDTINYNPSSFLSKADRTVEDLLKKLPGVTVQKSGKIEYQGKPVSKFYIENLDMLGGKYNLATQNISASEVASVQVYENHQPIRLLKDIDFTDDAALNIKLKNNKMTLPSGNIQAGGGYSDRELYRGELFGIMVNKKMQMLFSGKANNLTSRVQEEFVDHSLEKRIEVSAGNLLAPISIQAPYPFEDRSGHHNNFVSSFNAAKKINDHSSIKGNISYQKAKVDNERLTNTLYLTGDDNIQIEETIFAETSEHKLNTSLNYSSNKDIRYINETFQGKFNWQENMVDARSAVVHNQGYKAKELYFSNKLEMMWKKGKNTYSIYSTIRGGNIPENRMTISSSKSDTITIQTVSGYSLYTKHGTSFVKGINSNSYLTVGLSFETQHDKVYTDLVGEEAGVTKQNRNRGYNLISSVLLSYNYSKNRFNLTLASPVQYYHIQYDNGTRFTFDKPVLTPSLKVRYRVNPAFSVNMSGGVSHVFGDILDFIENPIRKSYLYLSSGESGILAQNRQVKGNIGYAYRNTMDGLFSNFLLGYSRTKRNIMRGSSVSESGAITAMSEGAKNYSDMIMANLNGSKNFHDIKTLLSLSAGFSSSKNRQLRQDKPITYNNRIWSLSPVINISPMDWWSLRTIGMLEFISQKTMFEDMSDKSSFHQFRFDVDFSILPFSKLELYYNLMYANTPTSEAERKNSFFMDCGIRYRMTNRVEFNLDLQNLANQRTYMFSQYREMDKVESTYFIRPRNILISCILSY